jgi:hypothetical protein
VVLEHSRPGLTKHQLELYLVLVVNIFRWRRKEKKGWLASNQSIMRGSERVEQRSSKKDKKEKNKAGRTHIIQIDEASSSRKKE